MNDESGRNIADDERRRVAEAVKTACVEAAVAGYESAGISGLCHEGALEYALDAIRMLDLDALLRKIGKG